MEQSAKAAGTLPVNIYESEYHRHNIYTSQQHNIHASQYHNIHTSQQNAQYPALKALANISQMINDIKNHDQAIYQN